MGAAAGRVDGLAFMLGIVAGVWVFAEAWVALEGFVLSGALADATLADLIGVPFWVVALAVVVMAVGAAVLLARIEAARRRGGAS